MIKEVNIKTSIPAYKKKKENAGKVALYDLDSDTVLLEGDDYDWSVFQDKMELANNDGIEHYTIIFVPRLQKLIRGFYWR